MSTFTDDINLLRNLTGERGFDGALSRLILYTLFKISIPDDVAERDKAASVYPGGGVGAPASALPTEPIVGETPAEIDRETRRRKERDEAGAANDFMTWPHPTPPERALYHLICKILGCTPEQYMKLDPERKVVDIDKDPGHLKIVVDLLDLMAIPGSGWQYLAYAHRSPEALAVKVARRRVQEIQQEIHLMGTGLVVQDQVDALQAAVTALREAESKMLPYVPNPVQALPSKVES